MREDSGLQAPALPGFSWRPLEPADAPAFHALQQECAVSDRVPAPAPLRKLVAHMESASQTLRTDSLCAADEDAEGGLAAAAWVTFDDGYGHELRAYLADWVRPSFRGLSVGRYLIEWMEARAAVKFTEWQDDRPCVLRMDVEHREERVFRLYEEMGYRFAVAEETMRRSLAGQLSEEKLPAEMGVILWSAEQAESFHETYLAAFRDRPGFPAWGLEEWRKAYTELEGFRPDLSLLVMEGAVGVAYAVCAVEGDTGWVLQFGVNTDYRRRGLGAALLAELLRRFRDAGLAEAALDVNVNNDRARRLYARMGFTMTGVYTSYRKTL